MIDPQQYNWQKKLNHVRYNPSTTKLTGKWTSKKDHQIAYLLRGGLLPKYDIKSLDSLQRTIQLHTPKELLKVIHITMRGKLYGYFKLSILSAKHKVNVIRVH